jgi:signal transduction histidine kinase
MPNDYHDYQVDIDAVGRIDAVPTILDVVCATTGMGFAAVARVTEGRWIACNVRDDVQFGLQAGGELRVETTICHEIRQHRDPVIIDNVAEDEIYRCHPTPAMYGLQSYISMPIVRADGTFFGTLCAIDPKPHMLKTPAIIGMFRLFAELIAFHLDAHEQLARSDAQLAQEVQTANLREQFIAVLGHDLRNPLASIDAGTRILAKAAQTEKSVGIIRLMQQSVARMAGLIDNVMDFARGRMGGGFALGRDPDAALLPALQQVIAELQASWPERAIESDLRFFQPVDCDSARLAQMLSNLLGNALVHGAPATPIRVQAIAENDVFRLSVANSGEPIAQEALGRLFQPFFRADVRPSQQGLGLGLYIVAEIARAHGGTLDVSSTPAETRITFQMALRTDPPGF